MKVLHVFDHSAPLHSGYAFRSLAILREQRKRGIEVCNVTSPKHGPFSQAVELASGFEFHRTPVDVSALARLPVVGEWRLMDRLRRRILEVAGHFQPDVIHAHSPVLDALPAIRAARALGIPAVYEVRSLWEDSAVEKGKTTEGSPRYRLSQRIETYAVGRADHVITICEGLRRELSGRGVPSEKITVVANGVDIALFPVLTARNDGLARQLGLDGCRVLGFAGSFSQYEGLDLLVDAFAILVGDRPDLRLLLIGGGPEDERLRAQVARLGLGREVIFTGRVPHDQMDDHYSLFEALVYPRRSGRLTEIVTPLKPLEAMAKGIPVVASDIGGHRELVADGRTGFLFAPGSVDALVDRLRTVLSGGDELAEVSERARRFVETERTWASTVANTVEAYRKAGARS